MYLSLHLWLNFCQLSAWWLPHPPIFNEIALSCRILSSKYRKSNCQIQPQLALQSSLNRLLLTWGIWAWKVVDSAWLRPIPPKFCRKIHFFFFYRKLLASDRPNVLNRIGQKCVAYFRNSGSLAHSHIRHMYLDNNREV